ncbi:MAG TPA: hypothetical protein VMG10_08115 [Gemmataceae bacterium]|nr:hypothetical protein [Gemmataceae bacterium]
MGLDFLLHYGGRRLRQYLEQPPLDLPADAEAEEEQKVTLDFELDLDDWQPRSVGADAIDPAVMPQRFIDGCHYGNTVACLYDSLRHPIPVRLAEIGGVCVQLDGRSLHRQFAYVERVVCFIVDPFPWHEVEDLTAELATIEMRLLPALPPLIEETRQLTYDYASMEQRTYTQAQVEMRVLEELALGQDTETLSLVDGPLGRLEHPRAVGVIKQHRKNYLGAHRQCWQVFYDLEPGQRSPAFRLASQSSPLVSWFLKLDGAHGAMPNWGIVRIEISCAHFESQNSDFGYLDRLSNALLRLRCRQGSYARAPVSMEPIVRAEESLKSLLTSPATLAQRFYHLTGL